MDKLNCRLGDIAITVRCNCPENLGNIVRIVVYVGLQEWGLEDEPLPTWQVEILSENKWLLYEFDGYLEALKLGPTPDKYLRRISSSIDLQNTEVGEQHELPLFVN